MQSRAATAEEYLAELPTDRRGAIAVVREVILASLPEGYEGVMEYGMIAYASRSRATPRPSTASRSAMRRWRVRRSTCRST